MFLLRHLLRRYCLRLVDGSFALAFRRDQSLDILRVYNLHELLWGWFFLVAAVLELEVRIMNDLKNVIGD